MKGLAGIALTLLTMTAVEAADTSGGQPANQFITLGTHGGPVSDRNRSQPANALLGGSRDLAYKNGMDDFQRINHVPIAVANIETGHGGTYFQPNGGAVTGCNGNCAVKKKIP